MISSEHPQTAVYDANNGFRDNPPAFCEAYCDWLEAHGIDRHLTYRVEHHVIDAPLVRVFQVAAAGRLLDRDELRGDHVRKPFDVLIKTPPPSPEDYT